MSGNTDGLDPQHVDELAQQCHPILAGEHPATQGAVLADLLAIWLAGHPADARAEVLEAHLEGVDALVSLHAARMGTGAQCEAR